MSSVKAALKAVKSAIDAKKYDDAAQKAKDIIERDPQNYFA
jgi:superkiller protein 3